MALLPAVAAAAAEWTYVDSGGPYDYKPWSSFRRYLLWFPPYAVPMNLTFLNVTWSKPEAIWFKGTYVVNVFTPNWSGYERATIYVAQDGVRVVDPSRTPLGVLVTDFAGRHVREICRQGIAMVAPNKIIVVLNTTTQIWISDIYCLYGNRWFWLRLLPYNLKVELEVEGVELVNLSIYTLVSVSLITPGPSSPPLGI